MYRGVKGIYEAADVEEWEDGEPFFRGVRGVAVADLDGLGNDIVVGYHCLYSDNHVSECRDFFYTS